MVTPSEVPLTIDTDTFAPYSDALQAAALTATRLAAASLPVDLSFHRSVDPALASDIDAFSERVLSLASKLVRVASGQANRIREEEDVVDEFVRNIVDPMEGLLEGTDGALDVFLGKRKDPAIHVPAVPVDPHRSKPKRQLFHGRLDPALTHASHIPKPQLSFKHVPSNTDESPYIPATLIPHKWRAKVPLGYVLRDDGPNQDIRQYDNEEERRKCMLHPYYYELTHPSYPDHVFNPPAESPAPLPVETPSSEAIASCPLTFVSTPEAFLSMANTISSITELAVDLEHHSYRSYRGFLALMQVSTRQEDFVVDLLVPEIREGLRQAKGKNIEPSGEARMASEAGEIVARVFSDPSVIKVFHGAESDIVWLQQDFNIFVVGLFDTFHASKLLEFPKHSLAYLLETYCDFIPDKRYQLADWRIRPIPVEMSVYARSDTHFLLYIYDTLRLLLIERSPTSLVTHGEASSSASMEQARPAHTLIHDALTRSSRTALRLYEIEVYDGETGTGSGGWDTLARKWNKIGLVGLFLGTEVQVQGAQVMVYKAVHRWREEVAREEDESTRYVLPTHHLFVLAERAPTTVQDLLLLFGGPGGVNRGIPPVLKRRIGELVAVIKGALETTTLMSSPPGSVEHSREGAEIVPSAVVEQSEAISFMAPSSLGAKLTDESRLWTNGSPSISAVIASVPHASLFGTGISDAFTLERRGTPPSSTGGKTTYIATRSVLFGSTPVETVTTSLASTSRSAHVQISDDSAERFKDLMEKIHKTLVIAPVVSMSPSLPALRTEVLQTSLSEAPTNLKEDQSSPVVPGMPDTIPSGLEGQIEIPFVPAHKRQTLSNPQNCGIKDDTIVVVGQAGVRQRKRKWDKARSIPSTLRSKSGIHSSGAETFASTSDHDQEVEEFDYSSVPNLLDDESKRGDAQGVREEDERKIKRQRRGKGSGLFEYSASRAPPRDQREIRSGNKTHTFR